MFRSGRARAALSLVFAAWAVACSGGGGSPGTGGAPGGGTGGDGAPAGTGGGSGVGGAGADGTGGGAPGTGGLSGGGGAGGGRARLPGVIAGSFNGAAEEFHDGVTATFSGSSATLSGNRTATAGGDTEGIILSIISDAAIDAAGGTYSCAAGATSVAYQKSIATDESYFANMTNGACSITITSIDAFDIMGTFTATLSFGTPGSDIAVTNGTFSASF